MFLNKLETIYIIMLLVISLTAIMLYGFINTKNKKLNSVQIAALPIEDNISVGRVEQYTCSGKLQRIYDKCINFKIENGFTTFNLIDPNSDIETIKLIGGIIKIELKKKGDEQ